jgi:hypothetical protein
VTTSVRHIQLIAWAVLLAAAALLAAILLGVPWVGQRYLAGATVQEDATVASKSGAVQLALLPSAEVPQTILTEDSGPRTVGEGWTITTTAASRALVTLFDESTIHLDPYTGLSLVRMRQPRFATGRSQPVIEASVQAAPGHTARLALGTTFDQLGGGGLRRFRLTARVGDVPVTVAVDPESKACLTITDRRLDVVSLLGGLEVGSPQGRVRLGASQRSHVEPGSAPQPPVPRRTNLVQNAHFRSLPLARNGWRYRSEQADEDGAASGYGRGEVLPDGRTVVRFVRRGSGGRPADLILEQGLGGTEISAGTCAPGYLVVKGSFRILSQSLPGGGSRSTEYPLKLKLTVKDRSGEQLPWTIGFYAVAPDTGNDPAGEYGTADGLQVPPGEWTDFDSGNLLDPANPYSLAKRNIQPPFELVRLELIASGHDYESEVDSVSLWLE